MSGVRVLVGTRKGAFVLTSDGKRERWDVSGPHFAGWEIYHVKGSPVDPNRLYASQSSGWFGQMIQRSNDGGKTWEAGRQQVRVRRRPRHAPVVRRHAAPVGVQARLASRTVADRSRHRLRRRGRRRAVPLDRRRHRRWQELSGLRGHGSGPHWQPGAGGMCLHTIILDPSNPERIFIAISAAGAFRTDDGGKTWQPINRGLKSQYIPDPNAEVGHCVHRIAMHPSRPDVLFMQKHWDVMRSDDAGDSWHEVSGNLPTDFGFAIDVHAHEPETIYVVPIKSDSEHFPPDGKAARLSQPHRRQRVGSAHQRPAAEATATSTCCATRWRSTRSIRAASISAPPAGRSTRRPMPATTGRRSSAIFRPCCRSRCRRCHDPSRAAGASADAGARRRRGGARRRGPGHAALGPRRARGPLSDAARHDPRPRHAASAGRSCASSPASRISPTSRRTRRCPTRSRPGRSRFWSSARSPAASLARGCPSSFGPANELGASPMPPGFLLRRAELLSG